MLGKDVWEGEAPAEPKRSANRETSRSVIVGAAISRDGYKVGGKAPMVGKSCDG